MVKIQFDTKIGENQFKAVAKKQGLAGDELAKLYDEIRLKEKIAADKNTNYDLIPFAKDLYDPPIDSFFQDLILHYHGKAYLNSLNTTKQNDKQARALQKQQDAQNRQTQKNNLEQALINFRDS